MDPGEETSHYIKKNVAHSFLVIGSKFNDPKCPFWYWVREIFYFLILEHAANLAIEMLFLGVNQALITTTIQIVSVRFLRWIGQRCSKPLALIQILLWHCKDVIFN